MLTTLLEIIIIVQFLGIGFMSYKCLKIQKESIKQSQELIKAFIEKIK